MLKRSYLVQGWTNRLPRAAVALFVCIAALLAVSFPFKALADIKFTASLDRNSISANETVKLTLTFEGGTPTKLPVMPSVPNLNIQGPQSQGSSMIIADGQVVNNYSFGYSVTAAKEGTYVIPALTVEAGGRTLQSAPITLTVIPPIKLPKTTGGAFLKLVVPRTNAFVGEVLPVEFQLYCLAAQGLEAPQVPGEGLTLGKMIGSQNATFMNGQRYNVVTYRSYVTPVKAGRLDLGPGTMGVQVPAPNARVNVFGEIRDWERVVLESDPVTLNVSLLPRVNVPPNFSGAVGNLTLTLEASPTNVAVGDPITVKVQIGGRGSLDAISLPAQRGWDQFKLYPPTSELQAQDGLGITGTKTFKLTAVPQSMDIKELPAYTFSYFDPDQKTYRTLTQPPIPLTVRPSAASLPPTALTAPNGGSENSEPTQGILSIKQRMGTLAQIQPPVAVRGWFLAAQLVPVGVWLTLLIRRKSAERMAANPRLRRQRLVERIVREGVKRLNDAAQRNDAEMFFTTASQLLQEQLGERLDRPASAITESVLDEVVLTQQLPEETMTALRELFHTFNQAKYAPQSTNAELLSLA